MKIRCATDLGKTRGWRGEGLNLDRFPGPPRAPEVWMVMLQGCAPWEMFSHASAFAGLIPCPVCKGARLRRSFYCLACDRSGLDGIAEFPGLDVDYARDPEWEAEPTVYDPDPNLAGGTEKPAPVSTGVKRSRVRRAG